MSVTAMNWAKRQRTGSPARKAILLILADYANAEGVSYPSRQRLADETDMSLDSVDRNIKDLEVAKFLTKVTGRGTGPHQKPNTYRLNLDLEALEKHLGRNRLYKTPEPHEAALPDGEDGGASDGSEPHPAGPQSEPQIPLDLGRSLGRTGAALTEEPLRRTGEPARASARDPQDDLFQEWWEAYPQHGGGFSKDRARVAWRALSDEDRALALEQAERITAKHMTRGKPKDPAWWLHDRVFATMAEQAPPRPAAEAPGYFGRPNTPQWEAWAKHMGKASRDYRDDDGDTHIGLRPLSWHDGHEGRWFTSEWPPVAATDKSLAGGINSAATVAVI